MFTRTTAINEILALKKRKKVIQGGTWAGKTAGIIAIIINMAASLEGNEFTVVAESIPAIKAGALKDFMWIMQDTGRWIQDHYNATDRVYKFETGSTVKFDSFDSVGKAKAAGKRNHLFINEANHIAFPIADTLMTRTSGHIWVDFNPDNEFWAHTELRGLPDVDFMILNYRHNEACPQSIVDELLQKQAKANAGDPYWENWCRVYIDGEIGSLEGVIFNNWQTISELPEGARLVGYGLDYGYTNDPTAFIGAYLYNGQRIYDEMIYETGLLNIQIANKAKEQGVVKGQRIVADSSEPKSNAEIKSYGLTIDGVTKGKGSVNFGIDAMQSEPFLVTERSLNMISELRKYRWAIDKDGKATNIPIDQDNHAMDATRYVTMELMPNSKKRRRIRANAA